jgi:predicted DNA-binding protein YlxM (UPF0122 family)
VKGRRGKSLALGGYGCQALDLDGRHRSVQLLERYGEVLTPHQRQVLELALLEDWSLAEIAERMGVSRAAVHDSMGAALAVLQDHEKHLGLLAEEERRRRAREAMRGELADLRRRLERLEARLADV